jgi:DHA1 family multidrug resistance protein-like MFS transporter
MTDLLREAPLGQLIRFVSGNRLLRYPEELPGFELPSTYSAVLNSADREESAASRTISKQRTKSSRRSSSDEASPAPPAPPAPATDDLEKKDTETQHPHGHDAAAALRLSRTRSRQETTPYTEERLEVEAELALERTQTRPIVPQKTSDGNILVDWYTTDDAANPQNWSNGKRFVVSLIICLYTFVVYTGSAIYTSSELGVIAKFNVGPIAASLPLSLYVLAYGLGPLLWAPLSEIPVIGRSPVYAATMALFTIISLPTALVDNFAGLLVLRFLQGFLGSPCLATGAATMQDMYSLLYLPFGL